MSRESSDQRSLIRQIMWGLLLFGGLLAAGTFLMGRYDPRVAGNHPVLRALIVFGCVALFVGCWLALLAGRDRRIGKP